MALYREKSSECNHEIITNRHSNQHVQIMSGSTGVGTVSAVPYFLLPEQGVGAFYMSFIS